MEQIFIRLVKEQVNEVETELEAKSIASYKLQHKSFLSTGKQINMKDEHNSFLPIWAKEQGPDRVWVWGWCVGFFTTMKSFFKNAFQVIRRNFSSGEQRCKEQRIFPGNSFDDYIGNNSQNLNENGIEVEVEVEVEVGIDDDNAMEILSSSCPINIIDPLGPETSILMMTSSDYIPISTDVTADEKSGEAKKGEVGRENEEGGKVLKKEKDDDFNEVTSFFLLRFVLSRFVFFCFLFLEIFFFEICFLRNFFFLKFFTFKIPFFEICCLFPKIEICAF